MEGKSTLQNIDQLIIEMKKAQQVMKSQKSWPKEKRVKYYVLFVDFNKAFDSINRKKLLTKMEKAGITTNVN